MASESTTESIINQTWQQIQHFFGVQDGANTFWMHLSFTIVAILLALFIVKLVLDYLGSHRFNSSKSPTAYFVVQAIRYPLGISIVLFGLGNLLRMLQLNDSLLNISHDLFRSIDVIVWGQFFYRTSQFYLRRLSTLNEHGSIIKPQTLPLLQNTSAVVIILFIAYLLFITWDIDMTAWLASAGIIGIAVGFAAKDTVANLLSGVFILADSPYKIGDYIVIDSGERGKVTNIGLRSTRILTRDDLEVNIPNAIIANGKIINESAGKDVKSRVRVPVGVSYNSDIDQVKQVLVEVGMAEAEVCKDPEPRVRFRAFGASSLDFELLVWISDPEIRGRVKDSLNSAIFKRFHEESIEIPYSKHDVYIKSLPAGINQEKAQEIAAQSASILASLTK